MASPPLSFTLLLLLHVSRVHTESNETLLLRHLLPKQDPTARPVFNQSEPIRVMFGMELVHIVSIVEHQQTLVAKVWIRMTWTNELLTWNPKQWGGIKSTRATPDTIWTPDLYLIEDVSSSIASGPSEYKSLVVVEFNGTNRWYVPALLDSSCRLDVTDFPFDHQHCKLKFMSWTYDQSELDVYEDPKPIVTVYYVNSSEWDLHGVTKKVTATTYSCCPNPFVHIAFTVSVKRKPLYYAFNVIAPCIIQMMIILSTFFLPPDSGERVGVAITVLLVFAVYLEVLSNSLPKTSVSSPALSRFYLSAMAGSAVSIMATSFVLVIHFKGAEKGIGPLPKWARNIFLKMIAPWLCIKMNLRRHKDEELLAKYVAAAQQQASPTTDKLSAAACTEMIGLIEPPSSRNSLSTQKLVDEIKVITSLIHDDNLQDEIEEEWQTLAKVFDCIFFLIFLFYFCLTSFVILVPVYKLNY